MRERILELIEENCAVSETVTLETRLEETSLDSLSFIRLLVDLEKEFGVEFEDEELAMSVFQTAGELAARVEEQANVTQK